MSKFSHRVANARIAMLAGAGLGLSVGDAAVGGPGVELFEFVHDYAQVGGGTGFMNAQTALNGATMWELDPGLGGVGTLRLTEAAPNEFGSAWRSTRLLAGLDWSTTFSMQASMLGGVNDLQSEPGGDGFGFHIQNTGTNAIASYDGVGFGGDHLTIAFDTFDESGMGLFGRIILNGMTLSTFDIGALGLGGAIEDWSGAVYTSTISYNSAADTLFVGVFNESTGAFVGSSANVDLLAAGLGDATFGFTANTSSSFQNHDIRAWRFDGATVPAPATIAMLGLGGLAATRRRR